MDVSVLELFSIGVGPSSSHTVGPMRAANRFVAAIVDGAGTQNTGLTAVTRIVVDLYGSLALTGHGHGTDYAVLMGLECQTPLAIDPIASRVRWANIRTTGILRLAGVHEIGFDESTDLIFHMQERLPRHANGLVFTALDVKGHVLHSVVYYSVGGGFVVEDHEFDTPLSKPGLAPMPYPFSTAQDLLAHSQRTGLSIAEIVLANESVFRPEAETRAGLLQVAAVMHACIAQGIQAEGILPGGLKIRRRARDLHQKLLAIQGGSQGELPKEMDNQMTWLSLYAIAVNEENAAGGRVVTAPTNGAAGVIPAVLEYYKQCVVGADDQGVMTYFLTAGAIGLLYKARASLSAAEVGCQGEVGVACSMAAAGFAAVRGATALQIENAAEIGMEHHLGLTCDPIAGLVQIPCIERNAMGAIQAVNAAHLALLGDGHHHVSLDKVIATMRETGKDMMSKYKETAQGGLAVNLPEC